MTIMPTQPHLSTLYTFSLAFVSLRIVCKAQSVYNVTSEEYAALPQGFSRNVSQPFTQTQFINGSDDSALLAELTEASAAQFVAFDPRFGQLVGSSPQLTLLAQKDYAFAHEGPVYLPDTDEVFFVSNTLKDGDDRYSELWAIKLDSGALRQIDPCARVVTPNGATFYRGQIALLIQGETEGDEASPGGIILLDPQTGDCGYLLNNFLGLSFNSPNDIVTTSNGALWFTDPSYAFDQGLKSGSPQLGNYVWRYDPNQAVPRMVADDFVRPNGLAISEDETVMYVTDSGFQTSDRDPARPHTVYAYDVAGPNKNFLQNRRVFALCDVGIPDGLKVDKQGNLWAGCGDGINVWNTEGELIGKILIDGGISNFAFAGPTRRTLVMLNEKKVFKVDLSLPLGI